MIELELTRICASTLMPLGKIYMVGKKFKVWTADEKRGESERKVTYVDGVPVNESYLEVTDLIQQHIYMSNYTKRQNLRAHGDPLGDPEA